MRCSFFFSSRGVEVFTVLFLRFCFHLLVGSGLTLALEAGTWLSRPSLPPRAPRCSPASTLGPPLTPTLAGGRWPVVVVAAAAVSG